MTDEEYEKWMADADRLLNRCPYYNMDGEPITYREWIELFRMGRDGEDDARRVAKTQVGHYFVSTVLLGTDHGFGFSEYPIIFETMIFDDRKESGSSVYEERYTNKVAALAGHDQAVQRARQEDFE
jgi:hypothetical protein